MSYLLTFLLWIQPFFLWYFTTINGIYTLFLLLGSLKFYFRQKELIVEDFTNILSSNSLPQITFIVPMHNEEKTIFSTLENLLNLTYRYKRIIVVNDGSIDLSFKILQDQLDLLSIPHFYENTLPTHNIRGLYQSKLHPEILVIDKDHGGKSDAINAAVNACTDTYFINVDADTYIDNQGFEALIRPLLTFPNTLAVGSTIRVKNGCTLNFNRISTTNFPDSLLAGLQSLEYFRCFSQRLGWDYINGNFIIAGAFSIFPTDLIKKVGGFYTSAAEDMEIVVRLQHLIKAANKPYKIFYIPDPIAWTEAPSTLQILAKQRIRWHFGLLETLWYHKHLCFNPKYGLCGLFIYPFWIWGEALEPLIEIAGYLYILVMWSFGLLDKYYLILFLCVSFGFTFIFTIFCFLIEEFSFKKYSSYRTFFTLVFCAFIENFGYRQFTLLCRFFSFGKFFKELGKIRKNTKNIHDLMKKKDLSL